MTLKGDFVHPAVHEFLGAFPSGTVVGEVSVRPAGTGWELRHVADAHLPGEHLRPIAREHLRALAESTASGVFRPLKSAPSLASGWRCEVGTPAELGRALDDLYPTALSDWSAHRHGTASSIAAREFLARQTGRYGRVRGLGDEEIREVAGACCDSRLCLRRPQWRGGSHPVAVGAGGLEIPCLEPCAVFLELAGHAARADGGTESSADDGAGGAMLAQTFGAARGCDGEMLAPLNPRVVLWRIARSQRRRAAAPGLVGESSQ